MAARYRSRSSQIYSGQWERIALTPYYSDQSGTQTATAPLNECWDVTHPHPYVDEADLTLYRVSSRAARVSFDRTWPGERVRAQNLPFLPSGSPPTVWEVGWDALETRAMLAIQDTSPLTSVPVSASEIAEIPGLAKSVLGQIAGSYLAYQWAIGPMIQDLAQLANLQQGIAARMARHRKKQRTKRYSGRGRGVFSMTWPGSLSYNQSVCNGATMVSIYQEAHLENNRGWFTARLEPKADIPSLLAEQYNPDFHSGLYGNAQGLRVLYELIPWSFLIDYFTTLGNVIEYHSNKMPYDVTSVCLMSSCDVVRTCWPGWNYHLHNLKRSGGKTRVTRKRRVVILNPGVKIAFEPLISLGQAANLAALFASLVSLRRRTRSKDLTTVGSGSPD